MVGHRKKNTKYGEKGICCSVGGFTLFEIIVVIAIFGILSVVVLFNYNRFSSDTILTNTAYEVALSIRQAQVFGIAARNSTGTFDDPYGINININGGPTNTYSFFIDSANNNLKKDASDDEIEAFTLKRGMLITDLSVKGGANCIKAPGSRLDIMFKRPSADAIINSPSNREFAEIKIQSPQGSIRYVIVLNNGQIYVDNVSMC